MSHWAIAFALACAGCAGSVSTKGNGDDRAAEARAFFESQVEPSLEGSCATCHDDAEVAWGWLTPDPDRYSALKSRANLLDLESPSASLLLNKGAHSGGPALDSGQYGITLQWIQLESQVVDEIPDEVIETPVVKPVAGPNSIPLDSIGIPGAAISFNYQALATGMYITELRLAGGPSGATISHPLFVAWEGETPSPDPVDRFSQLEVSAAPDTDATIGGGVIALAKVSPSSSLSIHFRSVEATGGDGGGGGPGGLGGGCKDVPAFVANASPGLQANCSGCHGGANQAATNALDISQLGTDDANACGQVLSRVTLADPANSAIFLASNPAAGSTHPFQFADNAANFNAFLTAVTVWISAENAP